MEKKPEKMEKQKTPGGREEKLQTLPAKTKHPPTQKYLIHQCEAACTYPSYTTIYSSCLINLGSSKFG